MKRKIEEAKSSSTAYSTNNNNNTFTIQANTSPLKTISNNNINTPKRDSSEKIVTETKMVSEESFKNTKITIKESEKQTIETQTSIFIESIDQQTQESPVKSIRIESTRPKDERNVGDYLSNSDNHEIEISIENEEHILTLLSMIAYMRQVCITA